ncbi:MAG TPA: aspartyl protease family protein [Chloroflexia bacterium]|nr:aspartyl protease family protein [Chloroflexia bacterium]
MPSYNVSPDLLQREGPIVRADVTISAALERALRESNQSVPSPIAVSAIVDTGAWRTVIRTDVINRLGIMPTGRISVPTASSPNVSSFEYSVRIILQGERPISVLALELPLVGHRIECIIGRDVLRAGTFTYDGDTGNYTLNLSK